jgi:hypothetical protein
MFRPVPNASVCVVPLLLTLLLGACSSVPKSEPPPPQEPKKPPRSSIKVPSRQPSVSLNSAVLRVTENLNQQEIPYSTTPEDLSDCSGTFLKTLRELRAHCSGLVGPTPEQARSSADIYDWYRRADILTPVNDPVANTDLLHAGSVLFYKRNHESRPSHMGIVVDLQYESNGSLRGYRLWHGRRPGRPAAITDYHYVKPRSDKPLGVGAKNWIAASDLCPSRNCTCSGI